MSNNHMSTTTTARYTLYTRQQNKQVVTSVSNWRQRNRTTRRHARCSWRRVIEVEVTKCHPTRTHLYCIHQTTASDIRTNNKEGSNGIAGILVNDSELTDWLIDWLSSVLRPRQHSIGHLGDGFTGHSKDPTNSIKVLKEQKIHK